MSYNEKDYFIRIFKLNLLLLLACNQILSQSVSLYSKETITQDIDFFVKELERVHPEPFHSIPKDSFVSGVNNICNQLPDSLTKIDAWKALFQIAALLKEGHTYIFPPMFEIGNFLRFPYKIRIDVNSFDFIVNGSVDDNNIDVPLGGRIVSINSISTDSIVSLLRNCISAENEAYFVFSCEQFFDVSMYSLFGEPEYFDVGFMTADGVEVRKVEAVRPVSEITSSNYSFQMINDSIAYVDINALYSFSSFKKFCKTTFGSLNKNKVPHLIIDFRGNMGGDSKLCEELIRYIANEPFSLWEKAIAKYNPASKKFSSDIIDGESLVSIEFTKSDKYMIHPCSSKKRYSGNVYVLVNGGTFSSAGACVWCLDHYNLATIVGSETGGTGVHYGNPMRGFLPNTGLMYSISSVKWYQIGANDDSGFGLIPNHIIEMSVEDVKLKKDSELEFVLKRILDEIN